MTQTPEILHHTKLVHYVDCGIIPCTDCKIYGICTEPCFSSKQAVEMVGSIEK